VKTVEASSSGRQNGANPDLGAPRTLFRFANLINARLSDIRNHSRMGTTLDADGFKKFLTLLHPDPSISSKEYLVLRLKVTKYFEFNRCEFADECADIVLERVAKRAVEVGDVRDIIDFTFGTCRVYHMEIRKKRARTQKAMEELCREWDLVIDGCHVETRHECLEHCLAEVEEGKVVLRYFQLARGAKGALADELGMSENALAQLVFKAKPKLRACIEDCLDRKLMR
jgi:hypothetical protein